MKRLRLLLSAGALSGLLAVPATAYGACLKLSIAVGGNKCVDEGTGGGLILNYLKAFLKFALAGVGAVIVLMIILAGIQYITAAGDPTNIKAAKDRLMNAIIALFLYIFAFAILSFLVPGGLK